MINRLYGDCLFHVMHNVPVLELMAMGLLIACTMTFVVLSDGLAASHLPFHDVYKFIDY